MPAYAAVDPDPPFGKQRLQGLRDGPANQGLDPQFCQLGNTLLNVAGRKRMFAAGYLDAIDQLGHQELAGDIEDRRHPPSPHRYTDSHGGSELHVAYRATPGEAPTP